jgi:FkbM family methyltransferase
MITKTKEYLNNIRLNAQSIARKIRLHHSIPKHKVTHLRKAIDCKHKWYGSSYGGFYINPDFINEQSIIYSFGIGKDVTFDMTCINKHGCSVFGFDPTPKSINYIHTHKISPLFKFHNYGIATTTGCQDFFLPSNERGVSGSLVHSEVVDISKKIQVQMKSFDDIARQLGHNKIDVLKMDIEGAEYEVLQAIMKSKIRINQILVEFHDRLFDTAEFKSKEIVQLMKKNGFVIFAASISYEEISFIQSDLFN